MKITQECDYAIRIVLYLAKNAEGYKAGAKELSEKQSIPLRFTVKILRKLIMEGVLTSFKGVNGGYMLCKYPNEITLLMIIEAVDGPILINKCLSDDIACNKGDEHACPIHAEFGIIRDEVRKKLSEINFENLSKK